MSETSRFPSIAKLERRMRPGGYSTQGFLGPIESLQVVIARDQETLENLGVSHEEIAEALENILQVVKEQISQLLQFRQRGEKVQEYRKRGEEYSARSVHIPDLYHHESIPSFSLENLPSVDQGYLVGNKFHVFIAQYRGLQECPWECEHEEWSSFDFLLLNREIGEYVTGPGMIVHLLRKHHFFEGLESPYRVDPARAVRVLGLGSNTTIK
ncbi:MULTISPECIES: hypothetical protein [unclassified Leptolyngbya]|uniref:hypothetical protein n=1 Tax=unclassified Leptolyngbya TaxID=2650499 RepID=UPI001689F312|nr:MULTISPECIES: hypothetical protein [unclassified Leptolyngbya]MBD1909489.1 hypothetical protein [Leptolyngbya sp. FACHB-8]MBD2155160.1 hypothetical protein [Leptolyngbya sp. FACHB-16]